MPYTHRKTPAEKARETRTLKLADAIHAHLVSLAASKAAEADVVAVFAAMKAPRAMRCDAFWALDNDPRRWGLDTSWHSLLRRTRNHPVHGPAMFANFD